VTSFSGRPTIPSTSSGLTHIQTQITSLLAKLNELPVESALGSAEDTLEELQSTLVAARKILAGEEFKRLPGALNETLGELNRVLEGFSADSRFQRDLARTLDELKRTLQSIGDAAEQIDEQPNSLVFPKRQQTDPLPRAPR
jgi:paraquat-inducible protein B